MIVLELIKDDVYMGKTVSKTWTCETEEKARSRQHAQMTVNKISAECARDVHDAEGKLVRIVIDATTKSPPPAPAPLKAEGNATAPASLEELMQPCESVQEENEACAVLVERILGQNNNLSALIRSRVAPRKAS